MQVLAIDTSSASGSVALVTGDALRAEISAHGRGRHGEALMPHVERVLELGGVSLAELDLLAVGRGPGSFTGLRVGLATAKGLTLSHPVPMVGVVSLRVLARALGEGVVAPVVHAHKGEVYVAAYEVTLEAATEIIAPFHDFPADAARRLRERLPDTRLRLCGDGLRSEDKTFVEAVGTPSIVAPPLYDAPRAALLALEGQALYEREGASHPATLEPLYVRPSDAKLPPRG